MALGGWDIPGVCEPSASRPKNLLIGKISSFLGSLINWGIISYHIISYQGNKKHLSPISQRSWIIWCWTPTSPPENHPEADPGQKASPSRSWRIACGETWGLKFATPQVWELKGDRMGTIVAIVYLQHSGIVCNELVLHYKTTNVWELIAMEW